jgi:hypothetical protein
MWELQDHHRLTPQGYFRERYDKGGSAKTFACDEKGANLNTGDQAANLARMTHD